MRATIFGAAIAACAGLLGCDDDASASDPATACQGVLLEFRTRCPVTSDQVVSVRDTQEGVELRLAPGVGYAASVENLIECYQATWAGRTRETAGECLFDDPRVDVDVKDDAEGRVTIEMTADRGRLAELRSKAGRYTSTAER